MKGNLSLFANSRENVVLVPDRIIHQPKPQADCQMKHRRPALENRVFNNFEIKPLFNKRLIKSYHSSSKARRQVPINEKNVQSV